MARPSFTSPCTYGCGYVGFSHKDQADADRARDNHEQRCSENPDNDPYSWRDN